jgi:hypothetical protein
MDVSTVSPFAYCLPSLCLRAQSRRASPGLPSPVILSDEIALPVKSKRITY